LPSRRHPAHHRRGNPEPTRVIPWLDRAALALTLILPAFLMHGRAVAEIDLALVDLLFLARCVATGDWAWLRRGWVRIAGAWWLWQLLCSLPFVGIGGTASLTQAIVIVRYLVFAAALEHTVLATPAARRWMQGVIVAATLYIASQAWMQLLVGRNLWGYPRFPDGALTGPFYLPRAGAPLARLLPPAALPSIARLIDGPARQPLGGALLAILAIGTEVLIGQRMPTVLTAFAFVVAAIFLPRLRRITVAAIVAGAVLLGLAAVVPPMRPAYDRLVIKFSRQLGDFPDSDYGLIYLRAGVITLNHPIFGRGFDGYRNACHDPRYFRGWPFPTAHPDGNRDRNCNIHPHNHYLEAASNAGLPGLFLFTAMVVAWLWRLASGLGTRPDPLRVGLFVSVLINEWPVSSMSGFSNMESTGLFFLLLGYGLALARAASSTEPTSPEGSTPST
jgi:O-antigen ligase